MSYSAYEQKIVDLTEEIEELIKTIEALKYGIKQKEEWKEIDEYAGYQISSHGRAISDSRKGGGKILKNQLVRKYMTILMTKNNKQKRFLIHRLVAKQFIKNEENKPFVNHKDGNKLNNHISNLEWVTRAENSAHAAANGLYRSGEKNGRAKITEKDVLKIRKMRALGTKLTVIAKLFDLSIATTSHICLRKTWRGV